MATRSTVPPEVKGYARKLGGYSGMAIAEMRARQQGAERVLGGELTRIRRDPLWGTTRALALKSARDPGIDPSILARIRGRLAARTTAETAGATRGIVSQMARGNIRGPAAVSAMQLARNRGAIARNVGGLQIDQWAAERTQQEQGAAIARLTSILQAQHGLSSAMAGRYAQTLLQYDPMAMLRQQQQYMAPVGVLAEGLALKGGTR